MSTTNLRQIQIQPSKIFARLSQTAIFFLALAADLFLAAGRLDWWASRVNTFLSAQVRIQEERGHRAIVAGPYRLVRHPMYLGMILLDIGLPLLLGSFWALIVSGVMIALVIVRTALEDRTLQAELPGYSEFVHLTPYRLFPGVWLILNLEVQNVNDQ